MASQIEYTFVAPYYDPSNAKQSISYAVTTGSTALVFRGTMPTEFPISVTLTEYVQINAADYFFYSIPSKVFNIPGLRSSTLGFTIVANSPIVGATANGEQFWRDQGLAVKFSFLYNQNAYKVQQIGRATFLDMFSKIFALSSATFAILTLFMNQTERIWKYFQQKRREKAGKGNNASQKELKETNAVVADAE